MATQSTLGDSCINDSSVVTSYKLQSSRPSHMSEYIERYRSEIDSSSVRDAFPEITESETPIWVGKPSFASMSDKYVLASIVLLAHFSFFFGEMLQPSEGEQHSNFLISSLFWAISNTGVTGFVLIMLIITKFNHYINFSTSGKWTTTWLIFSTFVPLFWKIMDIIEWFATIFSSDFSNPLPEWNFTWFAPLGLSSFAIMVIFTRLYQNSFNYAITDKRIHIRQSFLYFETSSHGISYHKVENLKADPTILGRILGFGNIHIVTGSGVGLQVESLGAKSGLSADLTEDNTRRTRPLSMIFGMIAVQRNRTVMASDPADCFFGISNPMEVYRLINELMDESVGPAGTIHSGMQTN